MKKSILIGICLVAVFFFAGTTDVVAQWSVTVNWNDSQCNCTQPSKTISWEIRYTSDNSLFSSGILSMVGNSPYVLSGFEEIDLDSHDTFYVCARVSYWDPTLCCSGYACDTFDADQLYYGTEELNIIMN